jgi:hypothetical protein
MKHRAFPALLACAVLLAGEDARAQTPGVAPLPAEKADEKTWAFSAAVYTYLLPEETDYAQPAFTADRDKLHLEARYNYEGRKTASAWIGYNLSFGEEVTFDLTPMIGGVFGDTDGIAPGYRFSLGWRKLELVSESEYVFDSRGSEDSFFYTWSELAWAPRDWVRLGMVAQRTRAYQTELDIQRGFLVGVSWKKASFTTYVFNPDTDRTTVVLGLVLDF